MSVKAHFHRQVRELSHDYFATAPVESFFSGISPHFLEFAAKKWGKYSTVLLL